MRLMISHCVLNPMNHRAVLANALILYIRIHRALLDKLNTDLCKRVQREAVNLTVILFLALNAGL